MKKYEIKIASKAEQDLLNHFNFLAKVSTKAARALQKEFKEIIERLEDNPLQFPLLDNPILLPLNKYRVALFAKRYKCVFFQKDKTIFIDSIQDCREDF